MSGGWNPVTGRDSTGSRPVYAPLGGPTPGPTQAYIPPVGPAPGYMFTGNVPQFTNIPYVPFQPAGAHMYGAIGTACTAGQPAAAYCPYPCAAYPNGVGNMYARDPAMFPAVDAQMPAANMTNSTGGQGCEPGYNYFFSAETTKVHVFHSDTAPWQLPAQSQLPYKAAHVPCDTTIASLLKGFGCDNPNPKKNRVYELVSCGNGKWYKGMTIDGKNKDLIGKTMKDIGWDATRTGKPGEKPVVCLWFCKG